LPLHRKRFYILMNHSTKNSRLPNNKLENKNYLRHVRIPDQSRVLQKVSQRGFL
jgi:hypothetical protein